MAVEHLPLFNYTREEDGLRKLYFDPRGVQTAMRLDDPYALVLDYTRAMVASLLFAPEPAEVLVIGLGGGTLSKFCHRHLPDCVVTTVEIDSAIIERRAEFFIPDDGPRFRVVHADALDYLEGREGIADLILLDAFDPEGLPEALCSVHFYRLCREALREGGVMAANLWHGNLPVQAYLRRMRAAFGTQRVAAVTAEDGDNDIGFALKGSELPAREEAEAAAVLWRERTGVEFGHVLGHLRPALRPGRK